MACRLRNTLRPKKTKEEKETRPHASRVQDANGPTGAASPARSASIMCVCSMQKKNHNIGRSHSKGIPVIISSSRATMKKRTCNWMHVQLAISISFAYSTCHAYDS